MARTLEVRTLWISEKVRAKVRDEHDLDPDQIRASVEVIVEQPDGAKRPGPEVAINFGPGEVGGANLIMPMAISVETAGVYWTDILVNKRLVSRVPLQVNYGFMR